MSCFINRKKDKIQRVFTELGVNHTEESFVTLFKNMYPDDWKRIKLKWQNEEDSTPPGKKIQCNARTCT